MQRILVTGAGGFVGRHVLAALAGQGVRIMAAVRDPKAFALAHPGACDADCLFRLDLARDQPDPATLFTALGRPDVLIHLAWGGLPDYRNLAHFETEAPRHYAFVKAMVQGGLSRVAAVGTCLEYGLQSGPLAETLPARPVTPYGLGKDILRRQLAALSRVTPFSFLWCRLFYMYGPGQARGSLFPLLAAAAARGDEAFPMSGGEQLRDYLPVETVADLLVRATLSPAAEGIVNVCSGRPVSVRTLVERWMAENGWRLHLTLGRYPYPDYEPLAFWGDASRLSALFS
ncbi:NAD-dependent epimerase/dehydratase family protein [Desulfovibrio sulfodismutans]|uniref:NAD-dependent epimerase/dehydratase family protein n=1 Tax=Desulfolutivibrio sulfodismutans TaxID=63561 RepID=A0A7K3NQS2_9BACT|nr:NAD-dependent epimerase/dehydratase family protein [Desulfolutivibrio sulfodismutans]NDY58143.1 NAD-dependent epimerase/dehydratase family protein [Desulfolutivibrio sulfodismutans]QLA14610.1 NAD-dependent epimerase/dehydratase family protein [Desulfolutivibrio sulfodismutans DSM 3696]